MRRPSRIVLLNPWLILAIPIVHLLQTMGDLPREPGSCLDSLSPRGRVGAVAIGLAPLYSWYAFMGWWFNSLLLRFLIGFVPLFVGLLLLSLEDVLDKPRY